MANSYANNLTSCMWPVSSLSDFGGSRHSANVIQL